jgi:hypothetical protein
MSFANRLILLTDIFLLLAVHIALYSNLDLHEVLYRAISSCNTAQFYHPYPNIEKGRVNSLSIVHQPML